MKFLMVFIALILAGCEYQPSEAEIAKKEYMVAQKCVPTLYELKGKLERYCGRYGGCKDVEVEYYEVTYQCKNGKSIVVQMSK